MAHSARLGHHGAVTRDEHEDELLRLAEAVRAARAASGASQESVAFSAGISVRHYQELESGRLNPSYLTLRSVAVALNVPLVRLLKAVD